MRYFTYDEYDDTGWHVVTNGWNLVTISEEDIRRDYYPYWYAKMCEKFGKEYVDKNYDFESCLADWLIVNGAWEDKE